MSQRFAWWTVTTILIMLPSSSLLCGSASNENNQRPRKRSIGSQSAVRSIQSLKCYDGAAGEGDLLKATDYIKSLRMYRFDNRICSCCFTGVWILYADDNFNYASPRSANWWAYGDNYCTNVPAGFENKASSIRFVGAPDDWKYDTLNLYFQNFFIGGEEFMYNDRSILTHENQAKSIIVTGCSPWTLYQFQNFQGEALCVFPSDSSNCNPGFYSSSAQFGALEGCVASVRRGCFSNRRIYPENNGIQAPQTVSNWVFPSK